MNNMNMHLPNSEIDEALWAAYRHDDKAAVMDYLFHRTLVGISRSTSFPQRVIKASPKRDLARTRAHCDPMGINGRPRQIALRSRR
jgi:hypothetical protein